MVSEEGQFAVSGQLHQKETHFEIEVLPTYKGIYIQYKFKSNWHSDSVTKSKDLLIDIDKSTAYLPLLSFTNCFQSV